MEQRATALGWAWLVVIVAVAVAACLLGSSLLRRHDHAVRERELVLQQKRLNARRELQQRRQAAELVRLYLQLDTMQWQRRDRALTLIEATAGAGQLKQWAAQQRAELAPYLQRQQIVQRYNAEANRLSLERKEVAPPASRKAEQEVDFGDEGVNARAPRWKAYFKVREGLRRERGQYCCRISTGKVLFSRAGSVEQCRQQARILCNALSSTVNAQQKCFYTLTTACDGGEVIAVGDVSGEIAARGDKR